MSGTAATLKNDGGRLVVTQVRRGTPAYDAGVNVDDEILAIDDIGCGPTGGKPVWMRIVRATA